MLLSGPQLRAEFLYLRGNKPYWRQYVRHERRSRYAFRVAVPYQCLSVLSFRHEARRLRWVNLGDLWSKVDIPQGCMVELPPVFSCVGSEMISDPDSGW